MKMNQLVSKCESSIEKYFTGQTSSARLNRRRIKKTKGLAFSLGRAVFLFSLCLVLLYPLLIMLSIALRNPSELYDPTVVWIPKHFTLSSFRIVFEKLDISASLIQTAFFTIVGTLLQVLACLFD